MKKLLLFVAGVCLAVSVNAQTLYVPEANGNTPGLGISTIPGNVGIGLPNPQEKLDLYGKVSSRFYSDFPAIKALFGHYGNAGGLSIIAQGANNTTLGSGDIRFLTSVSNSNNSSTESPTDLRMIIKYNGNIGIGVNSPDYKLQVQKSNSLPALMIGGGFSGSPRIQTYGLDADPNAWMGLGTDMGGKSYEHSIYFPNANGIGRLTLGSYNGSVYSTKLTLLENGNVGVGHINPSFKLSVEGVIGPGSNIRSDGGYGGIDFSDNGIGYPNSAKIFTFRSPSEYYGFTNDYGSGSSGQLSILSSDNIAFFNTGNRTAIMYLTKDGKLGIGTSTPQNKLDVNGTIHAREVKVDLSGWSDFVFDPSYKLKPLTEVEQFINTNGHLPEIPSTKEVVQNGVNVGEMQAKLLQKVEELTLYSIEQSKQLQEQRQSNAVLESKLADQNKTTEQLQQQLAAQAKEIEQLKQLINQKLK